jgi:hypothetical protein
MLTCPRCGSDAEYLADEVFSLVRCEFCGEDIDAADLAPQASVDHIIQAPPAPPSQGPHPSLEAGSAAL